MRHDLFLHFFFCCCCRFSFSFLVSFRGSFSERVENANESKERTRKREKPRIDELRGERGKKRKKEKRTKENESVRQWVYPHPHRRHCEDFLLHLRFHRRACIQTVHGIPKSSASSWLIAKSPRSSLALTKKQPTTSKSAPSVSS